MTDEEVLERLRILVGQVDLAISDYTDPELLTYIRSAARLLLVREVLQDEYTVGTDQNDPATFGIDPDPTAIDGELLAMQAAVMLLDELFRDRLQRGEIGVSWTSGLEQESTISAAAAYKQGIAELRLELGQLKAIRQAGRQGFRSQ